MMALGMRRDGVLTSGCLTDIQAVTEDSYTAITTRLAVTYDAGAAVDQAGGGSQCVALPAHLFLKQSRLTATQSVVGSEQRRREVDFHHRVAAMCMPDAPLVRCYYAAFSPETGESCLLFDDMSETHFSMPSAAPPDRTMSNRVIDALATFHAFWWDHPALGEIAQLPNAESVASDIADIRTYFPRYADFASERLSSAQRREYAAVLNQLPRLLGRVTLGKHLTLIHGDANLSNFMLPRDAVHDGALMIDWQLWGINFAAHDLAHLIALYWPMDHHRILERDLLKRYHDQLLCHGVKGYDWHACWNDYRLAVILRVLFMPMWFWTSGAPEAFVWASFERAMAAFMDLSCVDLLT